MSRAIPVTRILTVTYLQLSGGDVLLLHIVNWMGAVLHLFLAAKLLLLRPFHRAANWIQF
jgi:hypothetical protein